MGVDKLVGETCQIIILLVILQRLVISNEIINAVFCGPLLDRRLDVSGRGYLPEKGRCFFRMAGWVRGGI